MSSPRVLMVGYYGRGNFGDDVLMCVTHQLIREQLPAANIFVQAEGDACGYISQLLPDVTLLAPGRNGHFDFIVHGGGGVFSDLASHPLSVRLREQLLLLFGQRRYLVAERMLRRWLGKSATHSLRRIGMGIGVGAFSAGSPRLRAKLPILADFAALWVRDVASVAALARFSSIMHAEIIHGSDLAFLCEHWHGEQPALAAPTPSAKPRLGIALRDWPPSLGGVSRDSLQHALNTLAAEYTLTGFILDANADPEMTALLAPYPTHIWNPAQMHCTEFASLMATQDVMLTSRAHGAIISACVGVPSAIIAIEPKLAQVHAMLPQASVLAANNPAHWPEAVAAARRMAHSNVAADVAHNRAASQAAFAQLSRWFV